MQKQKATGVGVAWLWLIGLVATLPWVIFFAAGWEMQSPRNQILAERVRVLESQVQQLKQQMGSQETNNNRPSGATATATSTRRPSQTATPAYRLTPVADGRILVVVVSNGNVRAGPSTNHAIIGSVKGDDIIQEPLGRDANGWYRFCCVDNKHGWLGPVVVEEREKGGRTVIARPTRHPTQVLTKVSTGTPQPSITAPPPPLGLHPMYTKYLKANGAHILALEDVSNGALRQARDILYDMVSARPELLTAMGELRIILFDNDTTSLPQLPEFKNWESAGQHAGGYFFNGSIHAVAAPEQDLRCSGILTHEIGHAVEQVMDGESRTLLEAAYLNAKQNGGLISLDAYAGTNKHEYWAVAVDYWFRSERHATSLSKMDPKAALLVRSVFGDAKLSIQPCW